MENSMIWIVAWLLCGVAGAVFMYYDTKKLDADIAKHYNFPFTWCPSPCALVVGAMLTILGPLILIAGVGIFVFEWLAELLGGDNWFTRPICKNKDTT